jgi:FAD/FMN-containing dehydrogenase/Fe-S oxidoreductase
MSRSTLPLIESRTARPGAESRSEAFRARLAATVSGEVRFDPLSRALYSTDASVYQITPLGVVLPRTEEDVVATVSACAEFGVTLTARGAGTSQAGQAVGPGVQLDCSKYLNRVLEIRPEEGWARVEPGCVLDDLNAQLNPFGLHFAPDVSTSNRATIGGMIGNNSCGAHSVVYGKTVDHVIELRAVLANGDVIQAAPLSRDALDERCLLSNHEGDCYRAVRRLTDLHGDEIRRRFPKILRRVGGYNLDRFVEGFPFASGAHRLAPNNAASAFNLAQLLVGSEGTLAVTLEAKLRVVKLPPSRGLVVVHFDHLLDALGATPAILAHRPSAVEVVDKYVLDCTRLNSEAARLRDFIQGDPGAILIIEFFGDGIDEVCGRLDALMANLGRERIGYHALKVTDPRAQQRVWALRRAALGLSMAQKGDAKALSFVEDTAVSPEHLRAYIAEFLEVIARHETQAGVYAHASVGCLHVRPVINLKTEQGVGQFQRIADEVSDLVLKYGGALSGEHGDGLLRSPFQEKMYGHVIYNAFREVKRAFDPQNLLNPGKIVDAPPMTSNLRYALGYLTPDVPTTFDFSADGGLGRAAEQCAGIGACRKKRDGAMCPSYQVTREELHSTRGRANALRMALTGQLGRDGVTDKVLFDAFDLCLECKACKSECPTNVDMARAKAEFLGQYYKRHGVPLRNRVLGNVAELGRWGCALAPVSNWWIHSRAGRWLNEALLGIDRRRTLPPFAKASERRDQNISDAPEDSGKMTVFLFPDTFSNFYEPAIRTAAIRVLKRLGGRVILGRPWYRASSGMRCCGRPLISSGLLGKATAFARQNVEALFPWADSGALITSCEPSCILTIRDDYPALLGGKLRAKAVAVAAACHPFEDCCDKLLSHKESTAVVRANLFRPGIKEILVHGHCHQRALTGMDTTLGLLRRIPGALVTDLDAGCCGMAGAFGYEKEHYDVSRLVGEQRLFPRLEASKVDSAIVASGFSCRRQIEHFTGRRALHPATLLSTLINDPI